MMGREEQQHQQTMAGRQFGREADPGWRRAVVSGSWGAGAAGQTKQRRLVSRTGKRARRRGPRRNMGSTGPPGGQARCGECLMPFRERGDREQRRRDVSYRQGIGHEPALGN